MTGNALTMPSTGSRMISVREQSSSTIQTAIRSPHDEGATLKRANAVLGLYFDPDSDPETRAAQRQEFVVALRAYPDWAVQRAFDQWVKTMQRRPSPGEVVILAEREIKPLTDELARRRKHEAEVAEAKQASERSEDERERARRAMIAAGFTPKRMEAIRAAPMATTFAEAEDQIEQPRKPHWTETVNPDGPEMAQLRAARAANPLVQAALRSQSTAEHRASEDQA